MRVREARKVGKWTALCGKEIDQRNLGESRPCCAETNVVCKMKGEGRRVDAEEDESDDDGISR